MHRRSLRERTNSDLCSMIRLSMLCATHIALQGLSVTFGTFVSCYQTKCNNRFLEHMYMCVRKPCLFIQTQMYLSLLGWPIEKAVIVNFKRIPQKMERRYMH
jgi:hypothetical protein